MSIAIGLFAFPGMEVLDFAGPHQVFTTASQLAAYDETPTTFDLTVIASSPDPVETHGGLVVLPQATTGDHPRLDCLVLPGGLAAVDALIERGEAVDWVRDQAQTVPIVASVCTGAFLLAQTGLLNGLEATTHASRTSDLRRRFPAVDVLENHRWVDTGRLVTSAGLTAGIDMAVHLVERLASRDLAVSTARALEM